MIKLRITTAGGTKIELDIPIDDSKPASAEPAVPYQPAQDTPVETATESQGEVVRMFDEPTPVQPAADLEEAMRKYKTSATFPSNKDLEIESREGEKGEDGRIGGVGERKEDGEKGKPERSEAFTFEFPCKGGKYTPPVQLVKNHIATYGEQFVIEEYREAQNWLIFTPARLKTEGGTGKYLSGWLRRSRKFREEEARKMAAQPVRVHQKADNLLSNANTQTEGW